MSNAHEWERGFHPAALRRAIDERGLTQEAFASELASDHPPPAASQPTVSRWLAGSMPTARYLAAVVRFIERFDPGVEDDSSSEYDGEMPGDPFAERELGYTIREAEALRVAIKRLDDDECTDAIAFAVVGLLASARLFDPRQLRIRIERDDE